MNEADVVFFCLPDAAAREAADWIGNPDTVVIDTSTAHRVSPDWVYGMPELPGQRDRIRAARRIANPGCHASGFIALLRPLTDAGLISRGQALSCFSLTGYSGGGRQMIAAYEAEGRDALLDAPRVYGLSQQHKHLPEMRLYAGLDQPPVFSPIVAPYYAGMTVCVPLTGADRAAVEACYQAAYPAGGLIRFVPGLSEDGFLSAGALAGRDDMQITVQGGDGRLTLIARFDNLGKGACGAAIQNLNLVLGLPETEGLVLGGTA